MIARILEEEGLQVQAPVFAGTDVISLSGGRIWPQAVRRRYPRLTCVSVVTSAVRVVSGG